MLPKKVRDSKRFRRKRRIRKKVTGSTARPRLSVYRSNSHMYAQLIDDSTGSTLAAASTLDEGVKAKLGELDKVGAAREVGKLIAERAKENNVERAVFDRNGYLYHGRIAAVAEGAREGGLQL